MSSVDTVAPVAGCCAEGDVVAEADGPVVGALALGATDEVADVGLELGAGLGVGFVVGFGAAACCVIGFIDGHVFASEFWKTNATQPPFGTSSESTPKLE